jgi:hypothetical protein
MAPGWLHEGVDKPTLEERVTGASFLGPFSAPELSNADHLSVYRGMCGTMHGLELFHRNAVARTRPLGSHSP